VRHMKDLWALVLVLIAVSACRSPEHVARRFPVPPIDSYSVLTLQVRMDGGPEPLEGATVSREFFKAAEVRPFIGRFFEDREYRTATPAVAVIDHDLWQRRLRGAPHVIGTVLTVNDQPVTVVGVAEPGFAGPAGAQVWMPRIER
jgi:hypothetical protein